MVRDPVHDLPMTSRALVRRRLLSRESWRTVPPIRGNLSTEECIDSDVGRAANLEVAEARSDVVWDAEQPASVERTSIGTSIAEYTALSERSGGLELVSVKWEEAGGHPPCPLTSSSRAPALPTTTQGGSTHSIVLALRSTVVACRPR